MVAVILAIFAYCVQFLPSKTKSELSELEGDLKMAELYQFEPIATCSSDSSLQADTEVDDDDSGDEQRLSTTGW